MYVLTNAFSLNMLQASKTSRVLVNPLTVEQVRTRLADGFTSVVGHADTAAVFSDVLGIEVPFNRTSFKVEDSTARNKGKEALIVGQYSGPRLPEGCSTLPEGASIIWMLVFVETLTKEG